ncbi:MAG: tRNA uridine-5-carboxymethylaminomethyl(34) synthesis GTPase MnmE [Alphaproteobacteria bacterium]|nr:tRNA uridine-5-carboxymethylaminomethyl(34) synthesis GTPase MnmE [Alphaproteobacteria bacterium]
MEHTIYALATAKGMSGVAIIRVSGPQALESFKTLTDRDKVESRFATRVDLKHPVSRETMDKAIAIFFASPKSFTGEDIAEYHIHGGPAVIDAVLEALSHCKNHRLAEPGEFTRRAFENGKMDLTEAEGLNDLIHAQTQLQKEQALEQMSGSLTSLYEGWAEDLKTMLAYLEADLEFPDEDLPEGIFPTLIPKIKALIGSIENHLNDNRRGELLRDGIKVAIIGAPNAGKSSLLNAVAQRDVAIVSDIAGTTRDVMEVYLNISGYPVILSDTAGLRPDQITGDSAQDIIEAEGIRRALKCAREADIKLLVYDATNKVLDPHTQALEDENSIILLNKIDAGINAPKPEKALEISVKKDQGLGTLIERLTAYIETIAGRSSGPALTRERHREALICCAEALHRALEAKLPEMSAEDLRIAIRYLGKITGRVDVEDLLDVIFKDFCIGK